MFQAIWASIYNFFWGDTQEAIPEKKPLVFSRNAIQKNWWLKDKDLIQYIEAITADVSIGVIDPGYFFEGNIRFSSDRISCIQSKTKILWPVCKTSHWYLIIILRDEKNKKIEIRCLDGFNNTKTHKDLLEKTKKFLDKSYKKSDYTYHLKSSRIQQQDNPNDCGFVICHYAKNFCMAQDINSFDEKCAEDSRFTPRPYSAERREIRNLLRKVKSDKSKKAESESRKTAGKSRVEGDLNFQHVRKKARRG